MTLYVHRGCGKISVRQRGRRFMFADHRATPNRRLFLCRKMNSKRWVWLFGWRGNMQTGEGYVYFIRAKNGLVKIGSAVNAKKRLKEIQTMSPIHIQLVKVFWTEDRRLAESFFHKMFAAWRHHGEWFELPDNCIEDIKLCNDDELYDLMMNGKHTDDGNVFRSRLSLVQLRARDAACYAVTGKVSYL